MGKTITTSTYLTDSHGIPNIKVTILETYDIYGSPTAFTTLSPSATTTPKHTESPPGGGAGSNPAKPPNPTNPVAPTATKHPDSPGVVVSTASTRQSSSQASFSQTSANSSPILSGTSGNGSGFDSTSSTLTPSHKSGSSGVAPGAVAGIAIGIAILVALITFAITFFLMRKRRREDKDSFERRLETVQGAGGAEKSGALAAVAPVRKESSKLDKFKQPPLDDGSIKNAAFGLMDKIDNHAQNFYRNSKTPVGQETLDALAPVASQNLINNGPAALNHTETKAAIAYCIAELATSRISPEGDPSQSLLPLNMAHFAGVHDRSNKDSQQAIYWSRILGAYLYRSGEPGYIAQRTRTINELVAAISQAFKYWESQQYPDEERVRSLTRIFEDAAEVGILLYSQPSTLEFSWAEGNKTPALYKTADEKGRKITEAQCIVEATPLRT